MKYSISRLSNKVDKEEFLRFWNENHEEAFDERFEWIEDNPAGKALAFLMRRDEDDICIGCSAVYPRNFSIEGGNLRAGFARDFFILKKYRVLGPALKLQRTVLSLAQTNEVGFVYAFPNKNAQTAMKRAGFKYLGPYVRMAKPISVSEQLRNLNFPGFLIKALSRLSNMVLKLSAFETWYRFKSGLRCEEVSGFDDRFDKLWIKSRSRFKIIGERTSEFLTWKYAKSPNIKYRTFVVANSDRTELRGYVVYCMDEGSIDMRDLILPEDSKEARIFIAHFLRYVRRASPRSVVIQFLENREIMDFFKKLGFAMRECDRSVCYRFNEQVEKSLFHLEDSNNWLLLNGEVHY